jgi:hypothetical protein
VVKPLSELIPEPVVLVVRHAEDCRTDEHCSHSEGSHPSPDLGIRSRPICAPTVPRWGGRGLRSWLLSRHLEAVTPRCGTRSTA